MRANFAFGDVKQKLREEIEKKNGRGFALGLKLILCDQMQRENQQKEQDELEDEESIATYAIKWVEDVPVWQSTISIQIVTSDVMYKNDIQQGIRMLLGRMDDSLQSMSAPSSRVALFSDLTSALQSIKLGEDKAIDELAGILIENACKPWSLSRDFADVIIALKDAHVLRNEVQERELGALYQPHSFRRATVNALQDHFEKQVRRLEPPHDTAYAKLTMIATVCCFAKLFAGRFVSRIILAKVASDLVDRHNASTRTCIMGCLRKLVDIASELLLQTEDGRLLRTELCHVLNEVSIAAAAGPVPADTIRPNPDVLPPSGEEHEWFQEWQQTERSLLAAHRNQNAG